MLPKRHLPWAQLRRTERVLEAQVKNCLNNWQFVVGAGDHLGHGMLIVTLVGLVGNLGLLLVLRAERREQH